MYTLQVECKTKADAKRLAEQLGACGSRGFAKDKVVTVDPDCPLSGLTNAVFEIGLQFKKQGKVVTFNVVWEGMPGPEA